MVIVTPSRNLRDSILQSPDFLGNVFTGDDLGPHVVWLGRPSETRSSMCSWEDKVADLVNERLQPLRTEAEHLEATTLRPAFEKLLPWACLGVIFHLVLLRSSQIRRSKLSRISVVLLGRICCIFVVSNGAEQSIGKAYVRTAVTVF